MNEVMFVTTQAQLKAYKGENGEPVSLLRIHPALARRGEDSTRLPDSLEAGIYVRQAQAGEAEAWAHQDGVSRRAAGGLFLSQPTIKAALVGDQVVFVGYAALKDSAEQVQSASVEQQLQARLAEESFMEFFDESVAWALSSNANSRRLPQRPAVAAEKKASGPQGGSGVAGSRLRRRTAQVGS